MGKEEKLNAGPYMHSQKSVQRPDVGVEAQFSNKKLPKAYRYDSSLAPELCWDENAEREFAEWMLGLVATAAVKGDAAVFAKPQIWKGTEESFVSLSQCVARLKSLTKPFLNWAGKAERRQISVPTLPLFVHERHSTQAILETLGGHKARGTNLDLFGDAELDVADKLDAYQHKGPWTNRLVLGDSLQVMNSLLEYEGIGGQVQMLYFDPPYGVKFGSNFQPFVRKNKVTHGADDEMIREPEMVKAYRDTWELGLHSYLTYLRDRMLLARELLSDSGSIFVQISDENLHHVREVMDGVFGVENFVAVITVRKTTSEGSRLIGATCDYLIWYARNSEKISYVPIYIPRSEGGDSRYDQLLLPDKVVRPAKDEEQSGVSEIPPGARLFRLDNITSSRPAGDGDLKEFTFEGRVFTPGKGTFKTNEAGMRFLSASGRLHASPKGGLSYRRFKDDFGFSIIGNLWSDISGAVQSRSDPKIYAVQTSTSVIQRCLLMSTKPGDLVLDITCGSGTTAYVAEQWGRRWITCDTSRVPLALARQRLLTATFPWYSLKQPLLGPIGGFSYERKQNRKGEEVGGLVPRITLGSIANGEEPEMVTLVDRPEVNKQVIRVSGAFTVEATIQAAMTLIEDDSETGNTPQVIQSPRAYLDRMIEVLRQSKTLQLPGNTSLGLDAINPLSDRDYLHAEAVAKNGFEKRIAIVFGPEDAAIGSEYVFNASMEAMQQGFQQLFLFGFAIQAKAQEMLHRLKIPTTYISMTPDIVMSDLLKTSKASEIFSITGLPDITLEKAGNRKGVPLYQVTVKGLDIFRPDTMKTESIAAENLPCWMLDTDYNGMAFCASQVFFPKTSAWDNLQKSLKGEFSESVWEHLSGTVSETFVLGQSRRVAVKVIDDRGNELMVVKSAEKSR